MAISYARMRTYRNTQINKHTNRNVQIYAYTSAQTQYTCLRAQERAFTYRSTNVKSLAQTSDTQAIPEGNKYHFIETVS